MWLSIIERYANNKPINFNDIEEHINFDELILPAHKIGLNDSHYIVIDIKWKNIVLNSNDNLSINNYDKIPAYKC